MEVVPQERNRNAISCGPEGERSGNWEHHLRNMKWLSFDLTCMRGSVGQSERLSMPRSSVRFCLKPDNSNSHEFELHRPSNKGTKLLLKVIKAIIITSPDLYKGDST